MESGGRNKTAGPSRNSKGFAISSEPTTADASVARCCLVAKIPSMFRGSQCNRAGIDAGWWPSIVTTPHSASVREVRYEPIEFCFLSREWERNCHVLVRYYTVCPPPPPNSLQVPAGTPALLNTMTYATLLKPSTKKVERKPHVP